MAKWSGKIGFSNLVEIEPGIWEEQPIEKPFYGDFYKNTKRPETRSEVNSPITISNQISFIADAYANQNFHKILYATYMGVKWRINSVEVQHPRLIIELGGEYYERTNRTPSNIN